PTRRSSDLGVPWSDRASGLYKVAPDYSWPGFHDPNGPGECIVNLEAWQNLPVDLKAIIEMVCRGEAVLALAETEWMNATALEELKAEGVQLRPWPDDVIAAAREAADERSEERRVGKGGRPMWWPVA